MSISTDNEKLKLALAEAQKRGAELAEEIASWPEMKSLEAVAGDMGVEPETVVASCHNNEMLALDMPAYGKRFPAWQFDPSGNILKGIPEVMALCDGDDWMAFRYLRHDYPDASDLKVFEKLKAGEVDEVLDYIASCLRGAFS